jgi:hypothetical protein
VANLLKYYERKQGEEGGGGGEEEEEEKEEDVDDDDEVGDVVRVKSRIILQGRQRQTDDKFTVLDFVILVVEETILKRKLGITETCP